MYLSHNASLVTTHVLQEMKNKGEKDVQVSVTDNSNYLVEASKTLYAQEYAFEVETIFENALKVQKNIHELLFCVLAFIYQKNGIFINKNFLQHFIIR